MYENVALVPLSCDHSWTTKDFATYMGVLHKNMRGLHLFPYRFLKCLRKKNAVFGGFLLIIFSSQNGHRKELNQNLGLNSLTLDSHGYGCFELGPSRTGIFSRFLLGDTCSVPLLRPVVSFWSPALSWLHPDPSFPRVWVTRAITLPASTASVPQLFG